MRKLHHFPLVTPIAVATLVFLYLPVVVLVWMSFNSGVSALVWSGFGVHGYVDAWRDPTLARAAVNSLVLAVLSTVISTSLAMTVAVVLRPRAHRIKTLVESLAGVPLVVPEIVMAMATLLLFSALSIGLSFYTVLFAHVVFCLPFAYLPIRARLDRISPHLLEAAADLSATPWAAFWQITWPLALPGIFAGAMLAFATSMDDFVITYFVAGAGMTTLPMYIFSALKLGLTPKINAVSTVIVALSAGAVVVAWLSARRQTPANGAIGDSLHSREGL